MSFFRSQKMGYYEVQVPRESAWDFFDAIGQLGIVEFIDQNANMTASFKYYYKSIKRCDDIETKISFLTSEMKNYDLDIDKSSQAEVYLQNLYRSLQSKGQEASSYIDKVEEKLEKTFTNINTQTENLQKLLQQYQNNSYHQQILGFVRDTVHNTVGEFTDQLIQEGLIYYAGTIDKTLRNKFHRQVFRATKGNTYCQFQDIDQSKLKIKDEEETEKTMFLIFLKEYESKSNVNIIRNKITRILDAFDCQQFTVPKTHAEVQQVIDSKQEQLQQEEETYKLTKKTIANILSTFSKHSDDDDFLFDCSLIEAFRLYIKKEKMIYHNMNLMSQDHHTAMTGAFWSPSALEKQWKDKLDSLYQAKPHLTPASYLLVPRPKGSAPPTYIKTNEFTFAFQEIVNTYGVPGYREVNPALWAIAMFPFKFGVMFGDIGHGGVLFAFGIYLCARNEELKNTGLAVFSQLRYLLMLMGLFAFYCGFIYNDFFSLTTAFFGDSCFYADRTDPEAEDYDPHHSGKHADCVYAVGVDPKWYVAENELSMMNSLKMKMAVIIGVLQMSFGIFLRLINHIHYDEWIDVVFTFFPQIIFMSTTFGYMCFMIFFKWTIDFTGREQYAPAIIGNMINLPLKGGAVDGELILWEKESQEAIQGTLLQICLIMVPMLLFPKPILLYIQNSGKAKKQTTQEAVGNDLSEGLVEKKEEKPAAGGGHGHGHGEFDFGEICVHQVIEMIEFCLGCISNTASYLRLWALSLAHSQLAKVFFEKTIGGGIESANPLVVFIGLALWVGITMGVLMCMDLMECFLHALRLQWVEFQQKFYKADGYLFSPFSFKKELEK